MDVLCKRGGLGTDGVFRKRGGLLRSTPSQIVATTMESLVLQCYAQRPEHSSL
ncbi:unnamed protein product [Amoebophrya sp. A120]|nr:unnamed protein product [Amoebophrya sp. A120]|eukprot:GSA120T00016398001.1